MEDLFSFFFKYRPFFFREGECAFQWPLAGWQIAVAAVAIVFALIFLYRGKWLAVDRRARTALLAVRTLLLLLLLSLLMRPTLVLSSMVPKENLFAVVVDNSRSVAIPGPDREEVSRIHQLVDPSSSFSHALEEKFYVRRFKFDSSPQRLENPTELTWEGEQTNIAAALKAVLAETKNLPLGGIVLVTDGSDNGYQDFRPVLTELKTRKVPVHTVGIGPQALEKDVELVQVSAPRLLLPESVAVARVTLRHHGFGGSRGRLEVRDGSTLVQTREIHFPRDAEITSAEVKLLPKQEGTRTYHFSVKPLQGEKIAENNTRSMILEVKNLQRRVLYVEGHPRWDYKFIRQSLAEDKNIRLETLLRTAMNKFYRQGIEDENALAAGFPAKAEELFQYHGIILGNVESSFFTFQQMEMIRDFVGKRGGGFLMLGGSSSFSSGKYENTPIEEILPVWLQQSGAAARVTEPYAEGEASVKISEYGLHHPALQLSLEEKENQRIWASLPELKDWNIVQSAKSGAVILAHGTGAENKDVPLLAYQRYGRGHTLAFLTGSSWRWQMLQDHKDQSHETFWRQMLRWMVSTAKDPVTVETERETYAKNEAVQIRAEINDRLFTRVNDALVEASVVAPSGQEDKIVLSWNPGEDGIFKSQWVPAEDGLHQIRVSARGDAADEVYGTAEVYFLVSSKTREYFDAVQKKDFLEKLAQDTGGRYYTLANVDDLPEEAAYNTTRASVIEVFDLWDMPINLIVLLGLLLTEWTLRKKYGVI
ncbi:MAG: VWA domain-containing protein [Acidobacteria bacterium]|nr:VWA domain-containing protein [Acidobacteriota bacterium]